MTTDDERFEALYRKFFGRVYRFFRSCGVADDEAQDLSQETFKRVYQSFAQYRGDAEWAYLEKVARNVLYNWVRKGKTIKRGAEVVELDDPDFNFEPVAPEEPDYADRQEIAIRRRRLREAIAELPEGQRLCLRLRMQGKTYEEIASILGITVDAVKSRLRDAKKYLRARLGGDQ